MTRGGTGGGYRERSGGTVADSRSGRGSLRGMVSRQRSARLDFRDAKTCSRTKVKKCAEIPAQTNLLSSQRGYCCEAAPFWKSTAGTGCATMAHALDCSTRSSLRSVMRNHRSEDLVRGLR